MSSGDEVSATVPVEPPGGGGEAPAPPRKIPRERLEYVRQLYLEAKPEHRIQQLTAEKFGVCLRTARRYLALVKKGFGKASPPELPAVRARAESMLLDIYDRASSAKTVVPTKDGAQIVDDPDLRTMATAAWRIAELNGAVAPKKLSHDHTSGGAPVAAVAVYLPSEDNGGAAAAHPLAPAAPKG